MLAVIQVRSKQTLRAAAWAGALISLSAATAAAAPAGAVAADPGAALRLAGRLHPLVVHFPIALLLTALVVEAHHVLRRRPKPSPTALTCLTFGVIAAGGAIATGLANRQYESHGSALVAAIEQHQLWGIITGSVGAAALICGVVALAMNRKAVRWTYFVALLATGALTGVTGHMGGSLVYGEGYLTSVLWPEAKTQAAAPQTIASPRQSTGDTEAGGAGDSNARAGVYYEPDIIAIISARCENCHGPSRQRGGLRLDQYAGLFPDDPTRWVVQPFAPEHSEMMRRVSLPDGDDDAMPRKGERLSAAQIALIEEWIARGAPQTAPNHADQSSPSETPRPISAPAEPAGDGASNFSLPRPADVDWPSIKSADPRLNKKRLLDLAQCRFIDQRSNMVLNGAPGAWPSAACGSSSCITAAGISTTTCPETFACNAKMSINPPRR